MEALGILEIPDLSLDQPALEVVIFTDDDSEVNENIGEEE